MMAAKNDEVAQQAAVLGIAGFACIDRDGACNAANHASGFTGKFPSGPAITEPTTPNASCQSNKTHAASPQHGLAVPIGEGKVYHEVKEYIEQLEIGQGRLSRGENAPVPMAAPVPSRSALRQDDDAALSLAQGRRQDDFHCGDRRRRGCRATGRAHGRGPDRCQFSFDQGLISFRHVLALPGAHLCHRNKKRWRMCRTARTGPRLPIGKRERR